jgi:hypothetical protein
MSQVTIVFLEDLIDTNHIYRKFLYLWDLNAVTQQLRIIGAGYREQLRSGCGLPRLAAGKHMIAKK